MGLKLSNIIGAPFQDFVTEQLVARVTNNSSQYRTPNQVLFLANKTAWVRLASSVIITKDDYIKELNSVGRYTADDGYQTNRWTTNSTNLAQDWILGGGTSKYNNGQTELRSGIGLDNAYGLGGVKAQGYRPMPGLESVNIETAGRLGSLRYATIRFKVWNMNQLDIIDTLYFRLGYTMLLEWGHTQYFSDRDATKLETNATGIDSFFTDNVTKEQIGVAIYKKIRATKGNYDGMLGTVTNFDYSFNQEGGWDCSIKLIGLGSIMDSQKINNSYTMPAGALSLLKKANATIAKAEAQAIADINRARRKAEEQIAATAYNSAVGNYNKQNKVIDFKTLYTDGILAGATYNGGFESNTPYQQEIAKRLALNPIILKAGEAPPDPAPVLNWEVVQGAYTKAFNQAVGVSAADDALYVPLGSYANGFKFPVKKGQKVKINALFAAQTQAQAILYVQGVEGSSIEYYLSRHDGARPNTSYDNGGAFRSKFTQYPQTNLLNQLITDGSGFVGIGRSTRLGTKRVPDFDETFALDDWSYVEYATNYFTQTIPGLPPNKSSQRNTFYTKFSVTYGIVYATELPGGVDDTDEGRKLAEDSAVPQSELYLAMSRALEATNYLNDAVWEVVELQKGFLPRTLPPDNSDRKNITISDSTYSYRLQTSVILTDIRFFTSQAAKSGDLRNFKTGALKALITFESNIPGYITENLGAAPPPDRSSFGGGGGVDAVVQRAPVEDPYAGLTSALSAMLVLINASTRAAAGLNRKDVLVKPIITETAEMLAGLKQPLLDVFNREASKDKKGNATTLISVKTPTDFDKEITSQAINTETNPYALGIKGFNSSLMSGLAEYKDVPYVDFQNLFKSVLVPIKQEDNSSNGGTFTPPDFPVYIKLGYLLYFINNLCTLYDAAADATSGAGAPSKTPSPYFYIDYNPATNYCYTQGPHFSTDASICLVQVAVSEDDYNNLFVNLTDTQKKALDPKFNFKSDKISPVLADKGNAPFKTDDLFRGNTMEILLNTRYLYDLVQSMVDVDDHNSVYFKPFMERVLADVNKSLGDVNAFRLGYNDFSNTSVIYDDQFVPPGPGEKQDFILNKTQITSTKNKAIIPVFGEKSMVRDFEFRTNITTKMSSIIAIGAQDANSGATQSTDGSSFRWLNQNTRDRIIPTKTNAPQTGNDVATNNVKLANKFNKHLASIYELGTFDRAGIDMARNYLIQGATAAKALDEGSSGAPTIPLNTSFTIDGISGIVMGNVFLLPNSITPAPLKAIGDVPRFGFMVVGLDHTIENNQWLTKIRGQIIRMRDGDSFRKRT